MELYNRAAFFKKEQDLKRRDFKEILNPANIGLKFGYERPYGFYLKEALKLLLQADVILVFGNWKNSKGALIEVCVAFVCGIPIIFEQ